MKDVMLDFETLGNGKSKCLVQVGAIYFDKATGELGKELKINIDASSHERAGGMLDAKTVYWWLAQSNEARNSIIAEPRVDVTIAINQLNDFLEGASRIWSHATFDFVTLIQTLSDLNIKPKFSYKSGLDLRTLVYLGNVNVDKTQRTGVHHDALEDCKHQVKYCVAAVNAIKSDRNIISNAVQFAKKILETK